MSRSSRKTKFVMFKGLRKNSLLSSCLLRFFHLICWLSKRTQKKVICLLVQTQMFCQSPEGESVCLPPSSIISLWHVWLTQIRPSNISSTKCCSTRLTHMSSKQGKYRAQVPPSRTTKSHRPEIAVLFKFNFVSLTSTTAWKTNTGSVQ